MAKKNPDKSSSSSRLFHCCKDVCRLSLNVGPAFFPRSVKIICFTRQAQLSGAAGSLCTTADSCRRTADRAASPSPRISVPKAEQVGAVRRFLTGYSIKAVNANTAITGGGGCKCPLFVYIFFYSSGTYIFLVI